MARLPARSQRFACPRVNPQRLRDTTSREGTRSFLATLEGSRIAIEATRESLWNCIARYNPLGQFGAAWTSSYSRPGFRDR